MFLCVKIERDFYDGYDLYNHHHFTTHFTTYPHFFMLHDLFALSILIVPFIMVSRRLRTNAVLHAPTVLADLQYLFLFVSVVSYMAPLPFVTSWVV